MAYIEGHAAPDDMIIAYAHYVDRAIKRYEVGSLPVVRFQGDAYQPEPFYQDVLENQNQVHTLWLVLHQDQAMAPQNRLRDAAGLLYPQITGVYPNDGQIAVLGFSVQWRHDRLPESATPVEAGFANGLALVGYAVDTRALQPTDDLLHPPSNWIHVTTYWQRWGDAPAPGDFTPFVRLVDDQGGVWGGELQRPPTVFHRDPPEDWDATTIVEAHYDVNLNPVTPPGTYHLIVGIEDGSGARVPVRSGDAAAGLTAIQILP